MRWAKLPVLETAAGKLSQSGAILIHLAGLTGNLRRKTRQSATRRCAGSYSTITSSPAISPPIASAGLAPQAADPNVLAFLKGRFDAAAGILDKHLAASKFVLGDKPTIADFSIAGYVFYPLDEHGYDWAKSHPNIHVWSERMRALPGWKIPMSLCPASASSR